MARVTDGLTITGMTPIANDKVHGGVKPPGMTPIPTQKTPTLPVPAPSPEKSHDK